MDTLKNKTFISYDYISRYSSTPSFFDTIKKRDIMGIGSNMIITGDAYTHKVTQTDTLDSLALRYYNNPTYWWVIAYYNDIPDAFVDITRYPVLQIPNITNIEFGRSN